MKDNMNQNNQSDEIQMNNMIGQIQALTSEVKRLGDIIGNQNSVIEELRDQNMKLREINFRNEIAKNSKNPDISRSTSESSLNEIKANQIAKMRNLLTSRSATPFKLPDSDEEERIVERETNSRNDTEFPTISFTQRNKRRRTNTTSPQKIITDEKTEQLRKSDKPPSITVCNPKLESVNVILKDIPHKKTFISGTNDIKISVPNGEEYCKIRQILEETKIFEWFTYENKQTRPLKVMARGLHPETPTNDIKEDLILQGFDVEEVIQKYRIHRDEDNKIVYSNGKRSYMHLPLFMLSFTNNTMAKKVFDISYICNTKISIEALKKGRQIPQCKNCQGYNHTSKYCNRQSKCVKCGKNHPSRDCKKALNVNPKCTNCGGIHPANYRGCEVFLKIQKKRDEQKNNNKPAPSNVPVNTSQQNLSNTKVTKNLTFSQMVKNTTSNQKTQSTNKNVQNVNVNDMLVFMKSMMQKFDALLESNKLITNRLNSFENKTQKKK